VLSCRVASLLPTEHSYCTPSTPQVAQWSRTSTPISTALLAAVYHLGRADTHICRHSFVARYRLLAGGLLQNLYLGRRGGFPGSRAWTVWRRPASERTLEAMCVPWWLQGCSNGLMEMGAARVSHFLHHLLRSRDAKNKHPALSASCHHHYC